MGVPLDTKAAHGLGDMFLKVTSAKYGLIKGEAKDDAHGGEIEVLSWSWGMEANPGLAGTQPTKRATVRDLKIVKRVDRASTPLMNALRHNEPITEAVLTLRKAGGKQMEFLTIKIEDGRVSELSVDVETGGLELVERIGFSFNKITVEYRPQGPDGQLQGGLTFNDAFAPVY
jgi:type VI secretion system secreted protein Hcp